MGHRKFRMVARKNAEKKQHEKSAQLSSLVVSFSKSKLPAPDLFSLVTRLLSLRALPHTWTLTSTTDEPCRKLILCSLDASRDPPILRYSISIRDDFTWLVSVYGRTITHQSSCALTSVPEVLDSVDKVAHLLSTLDRCRVCEGNPEDNRCHSVVRGFSKITLVSKAITMFTKLIAILSGIKTVASLDTVTSPSTPTIRHSECEMLLSAETRYSRCQQCSKYRTSLHTYSLRQATLSDDRLGASSHTTYSSLTSAEKDRRMKNLHSNVRQCEKRIKSLREKLDKALESRVVADDTIGSYHYE